MNEFQFSMLTCMACDVLAISSSDILLKHVFSLACDVCHYCQSCLCLKTIQVIMLYMIDRDMKICKNFKFQNISNSYIYMNNDDNDNALMSQYISNNEDDLIPSTINSQDILNQSNC